MDSTFVCGACVCGAVLADDVGPIDESAIEARLKLLELTDYPCGLAEWTERQTSICEELTMVTRQYSRSPMDR